jgi:hypothetical protein
MIKITEKTDYSRFVRTMKASSSTTSRFGRADDPEPPPKFAEQAKPTCGDIPRSVHISRSGAQARWVSSSWRA